MKPRKLIINTRSQKYPIIIGTNLISKIYKIITDNSIKFKKCLLVIDKNIPTKMIKKIKKSFKKKDIYYYYFNANEINKNQNYTNRIIQILLKKNFSRQDCVISIGGGITGDLSGFVASLHKRGTQFINIPTTLLSQVDSSIGGKTGINTKHGKNLIGTFYQPKIVITDIDFLKSLSNREIICGYGEVLKHSLIANKNFYKFLDKNFSNIINLKSPYIEKTIYESCKIKKQIVELDEKEIGLRKTLNFGHTFAHAYEASLNFSKKLNHGEAVIMGIFSAIYFSYKNKILKKTDFNSIYNHIKNSNLPFNIKNYFSDIDIDKIISFMTKDKKNNSSLINLILLKRIGFPIIDNKYSKTSIKKFFTKILSD
tara:strand:+ start:821 stop:1927 length:1107 start_codon:yes stop_codon:yes gene_type:complete